MTTGWGEFPPRALAEALYQHVYRLMRRGLHRTPSTAAKMARDLVALVSADLSLAATVYHVLLPRIETAPGPAVDAALALGLILEELRRAPAFTRDAKRREDQRRAFRVANTKRWADANNDAARIVKLARKLEAEDPEEFGPRCRKARADAIARRRGLNYGRVFRILKDHKA